MEQALMGRMEPRARVTALHSPWLAAIERHRQGDTDGAAAFYQRHLKRHPQDAEAWLALGAALRRGGKRDAALVCYQRALRLRPLDAGIWSNLGNLWVELEQHEQALRCHQRARELQPDDLRLVLNHADALTAAGRFAAAEDALDRCLELAPDSPQLLVSRALVRLQRGNYRDAWPDYEARWLAGPDVLPALASPRWRGERIGGRHVLLIAERGCGDVLWAARFIGMLWRRGARLTLVCPGALHPVLGALPVRLLDTDDPVITSEYFDFHSPLMSLPGLVDSRSLCIPEPVAITVPDASTASLARRVQPQAGALRIGINWQGEGNTAADQRHALPLQRLLPLAALPGVQLFSLQKGRAAQELKRSGAGALVVELGSHLHDFGDTAAAIAQMDLVLTGDGAIAHLAGCLGKPVLALLPHAPHWFYGCGGESTPWYPAMRLIRQKSPGDWASVFEEVLRLVGTWAARRERDHAG